MSVALQKTEGVESATVSLNEGRARITLHAGNSVRLEEIRKIVSEKGFTPKEARIRAVGDLSTADGRLQFRVIGSQEVFPVMETPQESWREQAGVGLAVKGIIAAPPTGRESGTIQITEVSKQSATAK